MQSGGGGGDETVLFAIETDAKLEALKAARREVQDFGVDVEKMSQRSRAAWDSYSAAEKRAVAGAMGMSGPPGAAGAAGAGAAGGRAAAGQTQDAAALTAEVNRSIGAYLERGKIIDKTSSLAVSAYRREGDALKATLTQLGAVETELNAIGAAATKVERQAGAISVGGGQGRTQPSGIFRGSVSGGGEEFAKISPRVLSAANALTTFSLAASASNGSAQSMIMSLGMMSTSIAMVSNSARVAAAATGIGALVIVLGVVSELLDRFISKAPAAAAAMELISGARNAAQAQQYVEQIDAQIGALNKTMETGNFVQRAQASAQLQALFDVRSKAVTQAFNMQHDETKRTLEEQKQKHKQELEEEKRHRDAMAKESVASAERIAAAKTNVLASQTGRAIGELADPEGAAERIRLAAETQRKLRELDRNELLSTQQKTDERVAIIAEGEEAIAASRAKTAKKDADEDMKRREESKRAQLAIARTAASELIRSQDSLGKALKRAALEPIITWLEGTAAKEIIAAATHAASLDFFGAARHAGVAALAIAAGRRLAAMAGTGGGGAGGAGSAGGGGGTFTPSPSATSGGGTTINLYTRNPYGEDAIAETLYYTNRASVLKKPALQIPPTQGFQNKGQAA
jgi:hypothetical protein